MVKFEVGRGRPTENRVDNFLIHEEANRWVEKIDKAAAIDGADIPFQIKAVSEVLAELIADIKAEKVDRNVFPVVIRRRDVSASLQLLFDKGIT